LRRRVQEEESAGMRGAQRGWKKEGSASVEEVQSGEEQDGSENVKGNCKEESASARGLADERGGQRKWENSDADGRCESILEHARISWKKKLQKIAALDHVAYVIIRCAAANSY
jgi:hypothetical protein